MLANERPFIVRRIGMTKPPVKLGVGKKFWLIGQKVCVKTLITLDIF